MVVHSESLVADADRLLLELFSLPRSLSGPATRETLRALSGVEAFTVAEVPSGTRCSDWTVPDEWVATEAWIETDGRRIVDLADSNLHLVGYSTAFEGELSFEELRPHLHGLPDSPDAIPYRTSYYARNWGFCLTQRTIDALDTSATYRVRIVAEHFAGSIPVGERTLVGDEGADEFLFTTYACHPSLANDNLSGPVLWALLLRELAGRQLRNTYRFVIAPETIGIISWLARSREGLTPSLDRVRGGFVIGSVAGPEGFSYKPSFLALSAKKARIDLAAQIALDEFGGFQPYPFEPIGSDERQLSAPGWRIPIGSVHRSKYHEYQEYHTSLDDLTFVSAESLVSTLRVYLAIIDNLEADVRYRSTVPDSEPMLSQRGLYPAIGAAMRRNVTGPTSGGFGLPSEEGDDEERPDAEAFSWLAFLVMGSTVCSMCPSGLGSHPHASSLRSIDLNRQVFSSASSTRALIPTGWSGLDEGSCHHRLSPPPRLVHERTRRALRDRRRCRDAARECGPGGSRRDPGTRSPQLRPALSVT